MKHLLSDFNNASSKDKQRALLEGLFRANMAGFG